MRAGPTRAQRGREGLRPGALGEARKLGVASAALSWHAAIANDNAANLERDSAGREREDLPRRRGRRARQGR